MHECVRCGEPIDRIRDAWREVTGFVKPLSQGAKGMRMAKATGRYMHEHCMAVEHAEYDPRQTSLMEEK